MAVGDVSSSGVRVSGLGEEREAERARGGFCEEESTIGTPPDPWPRAGACLLDSTTGGSCLLHHGRDWQSFLQRGP